jgi:hypothetical protein
MVNFENAVVYLRVISIFSMSAYLFPDFCYRLGLCALLKTTAELWLLGVMARSTFMTCIVGD